jgi:hypothetical protein
MWRQEPQQPKSDGDDGAMKLREELAEARMELAVIIREMIDKLGLRPGVLVRHTDVMGISKGDIGRVTSVAPCGTHPWRVYVRWIPGPPDSVPISHRRLEVVAETPVDEGKKKVEAPPRELRLVGGRHSLTFVMEATPVTTTGPRVGLYEVAEEDKDLVIVAQLVRGPEKKLVRTLRFSAFALEEMATAAVSTSTVPTRISAVGSAGSLPIASLFP